MADTWLDIINASMGRSQNPNYDDIQSSMGAVQISNSTPTPTPAPAFTAAPSITGTPRVGQPLSALTFIEGTVSNGNVIGRTYLLDGAPKPISYVLTDADVGAALVYRNTATGGVVTASSAPVTVQAGIEGALDPATSLNVFQMGYNVRPPNYYQPFLMLNDWGKFVEIRKTSNEVFVPYAGITGLATVTTNTGVTLASGHPTLTVITTDPSSGVHRVNVTANATDTLSRPFTWTGTRPTYFTVARDGRTEKIAPEWIAGMERSWVRDLDMSGANGVPTTGDYPYNLVTDKIYVNDEGTGADVPYQDRVDAIAAWMAAKPDAIGYWNVQGPDLSDAAIAVIATYQRDNLPQRAKIGVQWSNENPWNTNFSGARRTILDGARKGWYGAGTTITTPQPAVTIVDFPDRDPGGPGPAAAAGTYIGVNINGVGYAAWKAKRNVVVGAPITEGDDWTRDHPVDLGVASRRWRSIRHNQIIEIYRSVFGQDRFAAQILPLVMAQDAIGEFYNQCTIERTFVPGYWDKIVGCGYGWYFSQEPNYDISTATAANLEASFRRNLTAVKSSTEQLVADCLRMGKVPFLYEGMVSTGAYSYGGDNPYTRAFDGLFSSELGANLMNDIAAYMKETVPGVVIGYDAVGTPEWSLRRTWADTSNKRYVGFNRGLDAPTPAPTFVVNPAIAGTPAIGGTVTSTKVRVLNGTVTRVRFFLDGAEITGAPITSPGQLVMKVMAQGLGGSTEFVSDAVTIAPATVGYRFTRFTPKKAGGQFGNTPEGQFYRVGTDEVTALDSNGPLSKTGWTPTTESGTGGNVVLNAIDNNNATSYLTDPGQSVNAGRFVIDVGAGNGIKPSSWDIRGFNAVTDFSINSLTIEVSNNGTSWVTVADTPIDGLVYTNGVCNVPVTYPS